MLARKYPLLVSDRTSHGVLILIDEVLGDIFHHELIRLLGHPCVDKGCKVERRIAVEGQFVADQLVRRLCISSLNAGLRMCTNTFRN